MAARPDVQAADRFIWLTARLLDRHRFSFLFKDGSADAVVDALRPYQNPDGGFGNALEPDGRGAESQPVHVLTALQTLAEVGRCRGQMVTSAIDCLASVTAANGGVPVALPSVRNAPHAPWWSFEGDAPDGGLLPTAGIVGALTSGGFEHPWLARASQFCWDAIEALHQSHPYEIVATLSFLDQAPERARAESEAARLGRLVRERNLVLLDPDAADLAPVSPGYAQGEVHGPLDFASTPSSLARPWFSDREIDRALDALVASQGEDGGWYFNWREWNPVTTLEWRGSITIRALTILRAYGRLE
jgi:hypothetical protein